MRVCVCVRVRVRVCILVYFCILVIGVYCNTGHGVSLPRGVSYETLYP